MRIAIRPLAMVLLALVALAPPARGGVEPSKPEVPAVIPATDEEHDKIMAAVEKAKADKDTELMMNALYSMRERHHEDFVPWIKEGLKSKDAGVLAQAVHAAASHELADEEKTISKLYSSMKKKKVKKKKKKKKDDENPANSRTVMVACVHYFAVLAIEGHEAAVLDQLDKIFLKGAPGAWTHSFVQSAVLYLGTNKWEKAVPRFVFMVEEPIPANVNSGSNPPPSYWEARYKLWQVSEGWVRWALKEITDKEYRTHREWKAWLKANEKKFD